MNDDPTQPDPDDPTVRFTPLGEAAGEPGERLEAPGRAGEPAQLDQEAVEVRRDAPVVGVVAFLALGVAVAYLLRAIDSAAPLDWVLCAVTAAIGGVFLGALLDARAPLMVVDRLGVRVRRGQTWQGVAWTEIDRLEHRPRETTLRDGELRVLDDEGRELGVRLSLSTRLTGCDWHELTDALTDLSGGSVPVVEQRPRARPGRGSRRARREAEPGATAGGTDVTAVGLARAEETVEVDRTPEPGRAVSRARRGETLLATRDRGVAEVSGRSGDGVGDDTEMILLPPAGAPVATGVSTSDAERGSDETTTIVIHEPLGGDQAAADVPVEPVVGPQLAAARTRVGLSVDQLAERTRIRPHVIEAIEVDDFTPCGGDFYARGHLRTLARVLGLDAEPLLALHAERYADAPIDPRRVFEAELATGGGAIRGTRGRLNWSVLVAAVMAVVLVWSVARLVTDAPAPSSDQPRLNGSPGGRAALTGVETSQVPVVLTAATGGARVQVRDGRQQVVFDDEVSFMQTVDLQVRPPVRVSSSDGGLTVSVDGTDEGAIGASGQDAQRIYVPR